MRAATFFPDLQPRFVLTRRIGVVVFSLMVGAALAGAAWGLVESARLFLRKSAEDELWARGVESHVPDDYAVDAHDVKLFRRYEATFRYIDARGQARPGSVDVWTWFYDPIGFNLPPRVRHDPERPERYVTSWQVERGWNRLGFPMTLLLGLGAASAAMSRELRQLARRIVRLRRECPQGEWELLTLPARVTQGQHGATICTYVGPVLGEEGHEEQGYSSGGTPLFLDGSKTRLAALRLTSDHQVVVPLADDLGPFWFSDDEAERLRTALETLRRS